LDMGLEKIVYSIFNCIKICQATPLQNKILKEQACKQSTMKSTLLSNMSASFKKSTRFWKKNNEVQLCIEMIEK